MQPADLDAILAIASVSPEAPHWQTSDYAAYFAPPKPPVLRAAFVAVSSGSTAGFATASLVLDPPGIPNLDGSQENRCDLDTLAVHPNARRQGIGSALFETVLAWARRNSSRHFTLEVRALNAAAIRLYERHGLRREGIRPSYYADPVDDALLLGMELRP